MHVHGPLTLCLSCGGYFFSLFGKKKGERSVCKPNWSVTFGFSSSQRGVDEILTHICSPHWLYSSRASSVARGEGGTGNLSSGSDELVSAIKWNLATFTPLPRTYCNLTFHHLTTLSGQTFYSKLAIFWFMNKFLQNQIHFNQPNLHRLFSVDSKHADECTTALKPQVWHCGCCHLGFLTIFRHKRCWGEYPDLSSTIL